MGEHFEFSIFLIQTPNDFGWFIIFFAWYFLSFQENYDTIKLIDFYICVKILTLLHKLSVCCFWFIIWHLDFYQLIVNIQIMLPKISVSNDKFLDKIPQFLAKEKPGKSARKPPSNIKSKTQVWVEKFSEFHRNLPDQRPRIHDQRY